MKYTEAKVGLWMMNKHSKTTIQLTEELVINILQHKTFGTLAPIKLNTTWLTNLGFTSDRKRNKEFDVDGIWIKNGVTIYESAWDGDFNYGTYVKGDGEFKGGFSIEYIHQLQLLFDGFTDGKLKLELITIGLY